jgi:hypothetical protein
MIPILTYPRYWLVLSANLYIEIQVWYIMKFTYTEVCEQMRKRSVSIQQHIID